MGRKISKEKAKALFNQSKLSAIKDLIDSDDYTLYTHLTDRNVKWRIYNGKDTPICELLDTINESITEDKYNSEKNIRKNKNEIREWFSEHTELEDFLRDILFD